MKIFFLSCLILLAVTGSGLAQVPPPSIEGSVRDLDGNPVSGATVYTYDGTRMSGRFIRITTLSNLTGGFAFTNLPPGSYGVHAYKETDGYADTFFVFFTMNKNASRNVQVHDGHTATVALKLGPKFARLKVLIRDEPGSPVAGRLSFRKLHDPRATYSLSVNADSELLVPPVAFSFEVSADGYQSWQSRTLIPRSGETIKMTVHLTRSP